MANTKERVYPFRELVEKIAGPEPKVPVYYFSGGRILYEEPKRPYGPRRSQ